MARYGDVLDRISFDTPYAADPEIWTQLVADLRDAALRRDRSRRRRATRRTRAFYAALESCDLDAMADLWEHSDRVSVTHPGWPMLRGWAKVAGSWDAIFRNTGYIQFVLTDEQVVVVGDTAWVTLDENILQSAGQATTLSGSRTRPRSTCSCGLATATAG